MPGSPPKPRKPMKRTPFGEKRRTAYQAERDQARVFEDLLSLHRIDWWHDNQPMRSKAGLPDYYLMGRGWHAWVELKAVSPTTGRWGKLSAEQMAFHERQRRAGDEVRVFTLPVDLEDANEWLRGRTGIVVSIDGLVE